MLSYVMKHTTCATNFDVKCVDAVFLAPGRCVLRGQHCRVGRRLVAIGFDLHAAGDSGNGLAAPVMLHQFSSSTSENIAAFPWALLGALCAAPGKTNVRSVTWTKVSLKEAKMRATPKTSSMKARLV